MSAAADRVRAKIAENKQNEECGCPHYEQALRIALEVLEGNWTRVASSQEAIERMADALEGRDE